LGTDSLASNDGLSIFSEMQCIRNQFPGLDEAKLFRWATLNGARALGISDSFGSFEKGKRPGVVSIDGNGNIRRLDA
jgi:cytosine/adenosine deaminase-related metal-dependent hydrolase